jgi:hypothetical protein
VVWKPKNIHRQIGVSEEMTIIYMKHIRSSELCARGARRWFEANGLSWDDFLSNGIAAEEVEKIGDALANRVVAIARKEQADGRK